MNIYIHLFKGITRAQLIKKVRESINIGTKAKNYGKIVKCIDYASCTKTFKIPKDISGDGHTY